MAALGSKVQDVLRVAGQSISAAVAGSAAAVNVLVRDGSGYILWATGTGVPTDSTKGYAKGCLFIDTDVAAATTGLYVNVGTTAACNFDAVTDA